MRFLDIFQVLAERGFGRKNARSFVMRFAQSRGLQRLEDHLNPWNRQLIREPARSRQFLNPISGFQEQVPYLPEM